MVVKTFMTSKENSRSQYTGNCVAQRIRLSRVVHYIRKTKDMSILKCVKATWFLSRINLRKRRRICGDIFCVAIVTALLTWY
jgi:hypothetical protein